MRPLALPLLLVVAAAAAGCGSSRGRYGQPVHHAERATVAGGEVSDELFAGAVHDLLMSEPGSRERQLRLQGVIARQMTRVASRFRTRDGERAVASLTGAMYLVHAGELTSEMLGPNGYAALKAASDEFAKRGDEGRARATYEMLARVAPAKEKNDIRAHLDAISAWTRDTGGGGVLQTAGALEAAAVRRHLVEPSIEARDDAAAKTVDFVERALAVRAARRARGAQISRDEGLEAVRALETGTTVLAAVFLRNADPQGALRAMDRASIRELVRPELVRALEAVLEKPEADRWVEVARVLRPPTSPGGEGDARGPRGGGDDEDFARDAELLRVAAFASACEAHRLDPTGPDAAAFVAATLVELGMGEAAPAVLADAAKAQKDPRFLGLGLALTIQAMGRALEAEEPDTVRRTFRAAQPLLASAEAFGPGRVQPGPAKVLALMGDIELRDGRLEQARTLLSQAAEREKSASVMLGLARLDAHAGKGKAALDRLAASLGLEEAQKDPALRAEILLFMTDLQREQGDVNGARKSAADALRDLAKTRSSAQGPERARIERLIARGLDRFGAAASALKALERALEAAPNDKQQTAATVGQMVSRAFLRGDLAGARDALGRGVAAELGREDIVYYALWVRMLERQTRTATVPPDNTAERVLAQAEGDPRWIGRVAAFGAGKVKADQLVAAAQTPTQKTEALFYAALDRRVASDTRGSDELLKQVVASSGIELMEWSLARELLAGPRAQLGGAVPDVGLP